ncbi:MAG: branched-chain amino acid aminotransferase [Bacillota bacterium]|nr:branched-chain amino acid aminotransferase [Bacillota bacterium]
MKIVLKTTTPTANPGEKGLGFGVFTDHMFTMDYEKGKGWHSPRITAVEPLMMHPGSAVLHYAQAVFEGMKAFKSKDDRVLLFRPEQNMQRMNRSCVRMNIPTFDEDLALEGIKKLVALEHRWIPREPGTSLYVRPFIIATDPFLGPSASSTYKFMVILAPVGAYLAGLNPVDIYVEPHYVRAIRGGTGNIKAAGNYAPQYVVQESASELGYAQVLWLDGVERKYVEEVGAMNVFFNIDGTLVTPDLGDTILPGVTRDSVIQLLKAWHIPVEERRLEIAELFEVYEQGKLIEAFGCGTAAAISPIGGLAWKDSKIKIAKGQVGEISKRLYETLTGMQTGELPDEYDWIVEAKS